MHRYRWLTACFSAGLLAMVVGGCGGGPEKAVVTGKVTYLGKPIKSGIIRFRPVKGTPGPSWGADIIDGEYSAYGKGGVPVGTHRVEIVAWRELPPAAAPSGTPSGIDIGSGAREQYLPAKYNTQSELEITIEPGSGKVVRDFLLSD